MFSVCALFYGNYPDLAIRLLSSLQHTDLVDDFRLGLNEVCAETFEIVNAWAARQANKGTPVRIFVEPENKNVGKYPLMRNMLGLFPTSKKIMWFDDDSYLDEEVTAAWWHAVAEKSEQATQIGAIHRIRQRGVQWKMIPLQPWYTGLPVSQKHLYTFATGGWWVADASFLLKWDYPFPELYHNGGDSILGELIRQQCGTILPFKEGLQCHCEACAKLGPYTGRPVVHINVGGRAGRRGIGKKNENYVWSTGNCDRSHQVLALKVLTYGI